MENKEFLLKKLQISNCLIKKDKKALEYAKQINMKDLNESQSNSFIELIRSFIDSSNDFTILKELINILNPMNKTYLLSMIDLRSIDFYSNPSKAEKILKEKLNNKEIIFSNDTEKYLYYSLMVNLTITSKNCDLIGQAINVIQEIN